ncbi:hypothetical protein F511_44206 [Dorcoceras hygrometricum]|uniref:Uncharacterized protein n=1 Tax=Dorcoceras hygrometricum TaxID=472368 RepID=A0A2Z6ZY73_9LAMI|nr:hypothetical protein F511_44206 [Dorcoceras hygrometricum]
MSLLNVCQMREYLGNIQRPSGFDGSLSMVDFLSRGRVAKLDALHPEVRGELKVLLEALVWSGEAANRLTQAHNEIVMTRCSMDWVLNRHNELMRQLESCELRGMRRRTRSQRSEEENKGLQAEVKRLQGEVETSWRLGKEKFLKSEEFETLCSEKASVYFEHGFNGCLAKFKANGYSEDDLPDLVLDMVQELDDMPKEGEMVEEDSSGPKAAHPDV